MREYQRQYLELLKRAADLSDPSPAELTPEAFVEESAKVAAASARIVEQGTELLRTCLFPLLDEILGATPQEVEHLLEFASVLMSGRELRDVGLHYRITMALVTYARHTENRDLLIRELYEMGMALYNMQTMLSPAQIRLYNTRMRMCFTECASHFEKDYDQIEDPQIRGYIHRSMGNIALSYDTSSEAAAQKKLELTTRSIRVLSDPEIRAKTPSLPWDRYLYATHQQCTSLLGYLRYRAVGPEVFSRVLESAQIVQEKQMRDMRERGEPLNPRWQYAYMAALYHSGSMHLTELLDGLYGLCSYCADDDYGPQSAFAHLGAPAYYMEYAKQLPDHRLDKEVGARIRKLTRRMCRWLVKAPRSRADETVMFYLRQFLYAYREMPGGMPFTELLQNTFAAWLPTGYIRQWIVGKTARLLTGWAMDDQAAKLVGILETANEEEVRARRAEILDFAEKAGMLYDTGMIHFIHLEFSACRGIFEEESDLIRLHTHCGYMLLSTRASTQSFAEIALGHHRYYDDKGGFPVDFSLKDSKLRPIISIIALADALASTVPETASRYRPARPLSAVLEEVEAEAGTHYSPAAVALLTGERRETVRRSLHTWRKEACLDMYRRRESISSSL